jgi:hypothetical protein
VTTSRLVTITVVLFVVGVAADLVIGYSPVPGYGAAIGLFGCLGLILLAKRLGKWLVDAPEDFYPEETPPDVHPDFGVGPSHGPVRYPTGPDPDDRPGAGPASGEVSRG